MLSQQGPARKLDLPTYPFQHRQYWFREQRVAPTQRASNQTAGPRTEAVRLLEDGRIEELAALLDGGERQSTDRRCAETACRTTQPAA